MKVVLSNNLMGACLGDVNVWVEDLSHYNIQTSHLLLWNTQNHSHKRKLVNEASAKLIFRGENLTRTYLQFYFVTFV